MLTLAKILLPVDFSERSMAAAHYAGMLACRFQSELTMLHVAGYPYPIGGFEAPMALADWRADLLADGQGKLDSFMKNEFGKMRVKRIVLEGDPAIRIIEQAHSEGTGLIVMPTHGFGPFRRFILGSVTAKVLHDADCPVFTGAHIENAPPEALAFRNILCAVDLGPQSRTALRWAADMAAKFDARLHVAHALPALEVGQARYFDQDWRAALDRSASQQIHRMLEDLSVQADVIIDSGDVPLVVHAAAESVQADLVVIGRHVSSGVIGRLRAQAYSIVRESPCPVVSV